MSNRFQVHSCWYKSNVPISLNWYCWDSSWLLFIKANAQNFSKMCNYLVMLHERQNHGALSVMRDIGNHPWNFDPSGLLSISRWDRSKFRSPEVISPSSIRSKYLALTWNYLVFLNFTVAMIKYLDTLKSHQPKEPSDTITKYNLYCNVINTEWWNRAHFGLSLKVNIWKWKTVHIVK